MTTSPIAADSRIQPILRRAGRQHPLRQIGLIVILLLCSAIFLSLLYWMVSPRSRPRAMRCATRRPGGRTPSSGRTSRDAFTSLPFARFYLNSFIIVTLNTLGAVLSSSLIGYGFARYAFRQQYPVHRRAGDAALPGEITLIPVFLLFKQLGWLNYHPAIGRACFLWQRLLHLPFRQFMRGISSELLDAAVIDGASAFGVYRHIVAPLSLPVVCHRNGFQLLWTWNDFFSPLITCKKG